jgi:hypothetical protein
LKYLLKEIFNHAYKNLRWIVCWDFDKGVGESTDFRAIEENDVRRLRTHKDKDGKISYFLDNPATATKIQVIRLVQFLKDRLGMEFKENVPN